MPSGVYKHKPHSEVTKKKIGITNRKQQKRLWQDPEHRKYMIEAFGRIIKK